MNAFMICNPKQLENEILKRISREKIAHISGANWKIEEYLTIKEFRKILKETPELDGCHKERRYCGGREISC